MSEPDAPEARGGVFLTPPRHWGRGIAVVLVLVLLIGGVGGRFYVRPRVDTLPAGQHVDAVVALGGLTQTALYAQGLVQQGAAPVLVLSDPYAPDDGLPVHAACASQPVGYRIICFTPDPSTTRGEAEEVRALATANHWNRVAVVAPVFHISRARLLMRRCYSGTLLMLRLPVHVSWAMWTYQYLRQTSGYIKAGFLRRC